MDSGPSESEGISPSRSSPVSSSYCDDDLCVVDTPLSTAHEVENVTESAATTILKENSTKVDRYEIRERRRSICRDGLSSTAATKSEPLKQPHVDVRGRPSHDICHTKSQQSLFSHLNRKINLKGFINLLCIIVVAQNARLVIENLMKYGVRIKPLPPSSVEDLIENWPILLSLILMNILFFLAFFIEKFVNPVLVGNDPKGYTFLSLLVTCLNPLLVLLVPYYTIRIYKAVPIYATLLLGFSITWCLKLVSFHHVLVDVRYSIANRESMNDVFGGHKARRYPQSLNFMDYYRFLIMPTLCYQFEYPRTERIRWLAVIRHLIQLLVALVLIKIVIEQYMVVILQNTFVSKNVLKGMSILRIFAHLSERILNLSVPNLCVWLLMFFCLFHHWLNILAEITCFADREFYGDWWNSSSFDEYWRKWNLPIHNFFNRHVHKPLLRLGLPRFIAGQVVFIISALAHEYMVVVPLHLGWTGLVFSGFMAQVPLIYLTSKPFFKEYPTVGNAFFWVVFCFTGQPLAIIVYYYLWSVQHGELQEVDVHSIQALRLM